jgi:hypothetical protein
MSTPKLYNKSSIAFRHGWANVGWCPTGLLMRRSFNVKLFDDITIGRTVTLLIHAADGKVEVRDKWYGPVVS